jgi:hypothetical protein
MAPRRTRLDLLGEADTTVLGAVVTHGQGALAVQLLEHGSQRLPALGQHFFPAAHVGLDDEHLPVAFLIHGRNHINEGVSPSEEAAVVWSVADRVVPSAWSFKSATTGDLGRVV